MKKNLRIVSAAAAALLAVAPVAATAMPVNAASNAQINLGGSTNVTKDAVDVTPSLTLTGKHGDVAGSLVGSVTATLNGQSYTTSLKNTAAADVAIFNAGHDDAANKVAAADVVARRAYDVEIDDLGLNFGTANAHKTVTIKSSNKNVKFGSSNPAAVTPSADKKSATVKLDQNGTAQGLTVVLSNVTAFDATNTNGVVFYNVASGNQATNGNAMVLANTEGKLNTKALLPAITSEYVAVQRVNSDSATEQNGTYNQAGFESVTNIDFASAIKDQLKAQNIDVDSQGYFKAPHAFTVKVKATSDINGKTAELPVTVTVANVAEATEPSVSKDVMHAAYYYDKDGKRVGSDKVATYTSVNFVAENGNLKEYTISGKKYYKIANEDKYIAAGNVTGTKRTLKHNAYVYATSKKRVAAKTVLKKGESTTTYGAAVKLKNGKAYYRIGKTQYVKKANF